MAADIYGHGFARVAAVTLPVALADPMTNAARVVEAARRCSDDGVALAVFPESTLTGYSIDDLVFGHPLLARVRRALAEVVEASQELLPILAVGAPLELGDRLYNCAVFVHRGRILGVTPKLHLPSYREFYEERYFATLPTLQSVTYVQWDGRLRQCASSDADAIPFGAFHVEVADVPGLRIAAEVCEDVWVPIPPSSVAALRGATVIANLSASPDNVGRTRTRSSLVEAQSLTTLTAYVYSAAGFGESSTDLSWDGEALICEAGVTLTSSEHFLPGTYFTSADVDLDLLVSARRHQNTFADNARTAGADEPPVVVQVQLRPPAGVDGLHREIPRFPFLAGQHSRSDEPTREAFNIQVGALLRRMTSIGKPKLVIGVSGGLDSTLALLVAAKAMDEQGRPRSDILAYTMPGFGTTDVTRSNAEKLAAGLGVSFQELDIRPAATAMLQAMGHPFGSGEPVYDVTFENVQAGLRTDYLFRLANQHGGIVVGTGDLSELALGWCTFGVGDQMSHYGVNAGVPKTMVQEILRWVADASPFGADLSSTITSILDTEISPELVPTSGEKPQSTQAAIGPYELQDFTLYNVLRAGYGPRKILFLQETAWAHKYSRAELLGWLKLFFTRFFANQYKRSTLPNGPKVMAGGSLSPRGDWRMPSDALAAAWLEELAELEVESE